MVYRWDIEWRVIKHALTKEYFSIRLTLWLLLIITAKGTFWCLTKVVQLIDPLLFWRYKSTEIKRPIFILANPRSGTTFLHRLMCEDEQFTYLTLYKSIFPSILWYKFFEYLGKLDALFGRPMYKILVWPLNRLIFGGWDGIHKVGFDQAEEDEATWAYIWSTPGSIVLVPYLRYIKDAIYVDQYAPRSYLDKLNDYLLDTLQRHMYADGRHKIYLGKNACAAPRIKRYLETMPDMRVIHLYRHPYESVASALSMFCKVWKFHSPKSYGDTIDTRFAAEMWCDTYRTLTELKDKMPESQYIEFAYTDFVANPKETVEKIYDHFDLDMTGDYRQFLDSETQRARAYASSHDYDLEEYGISKMWIYERLSDVFERYGFER